MKEQPSYVIRNAVVCDGSGGEPFPADLVLAGDRIARLSPPRSEPLRPDAGFDADGLTVTPGFIDVHAHSDYTLPAAPEAFGKISQGITSEISGNCGSSAFPVTDRNRNKQEQACRKLGLEFDWHDLAGYRAFLERHRPAVNYGFLCGHGTLRAAVMGFEPGAASPAELDSMRRLLTEALEQGAFGLSSGLVYVPGKFASRSELKAILAVLKPFDAVYATHMRNEGDTILEAVDEAIELARAAAGRLEISHLKTAFPRNWGKLHEIFEKVESAQCSGLRVAADRYPYTFGQTSLSIILPPPYDAMTDRAIQDALTDDDDACDVLRAQLAREHYWDGILLTYTTLPEYEPYLGRPVPEIAAAVNRSPAELTVDILRRDASSAMAAFGGLSPDNLTAITARPWVCCGSDENARPADFSLGRSHPRGFGAFPRFLRMAAAQTGFPDAVRRLTALPAETFGLDRRGQLRPGWFADLVLLDPENFRDAADYANPHRPAEGLAAVFVNGVPAYFPGRPVTCAGQFLSPRRR